MSTDVQSSSSTFQEMLALHRMESQRETTERLENALMVVLIKLPAVHVHGAGGVFVFVLSHLKRCWKTGREQLQLVNQSYMYRRT